MYNRKEIKVRSTAKPKRDAFSQDRIYANDGLFNPFVQNEVRVPSNVITTHGMPGNVLAKASDGTQIMMRPNQMYNFGPHVNYVDETARFSIGGGVQYMDVALDDDQIKAYKNGGYYVEELPNAQDGVQTQATTVPAEPVLTYGEYYAQAADAAKKAYDEHVTSLEKERQRVAKVRGNVIPAAAALDKADDAIMNDYGQWGTKVTEADKTAWSNFTTASNPQELEKARQALPQYMRDVLPNQGRYNVANWNSQTGDWVVGAEPSRELYCTPYGCFAYQKAGATDVPIIAGNKILASRSKDGTDLPFEKIKASDRQPGDMALMVEWVIDSYIGGKNMEHRPHHTTIYSQPALNDTKDTESGMFYNAGNGARFAFEPTFLQTKLKPEDRFDYYRYVGQTRKMEEELKRKQAAWEEAELKADRGPQIKMDLKPIDMASLNNQFPQSQEEITKVDYRQEAIDQINNMDISSRKKKKLLKDVETNERIGQMMYQMMNQPQQPASAPTVNLGNPQGGTFRNGGIYMGDEIDLTPEQEAHLRKLGYNLQKI